MRLMSMRQAAAVFVSPFLVVGVCALELAPLTDEQLGDITGQEGVLLSQEYYYNSLRTDNDATDGDMDTAYCSASFLNCRFTWQIAGREDGVSHSGMANPRGEWLVYKDGYLSLSMRRLSLDASFLGNSISTGVSYESFYNPARFKDSAGNCLLEGVADCDNAASAIDTIRKMPGLRTHYPETAGSYTPGPGGSAGTISGYRDVRIGLKFTGLAIEYDTGGTPGYLLNTIDSAMQSSSFMGFTLADNNGPMAGIAFGGDFYLYGF